jgi:nitrate/nitrite transporter NarK
MMKGNPENHRRRSLAMLSLILAGESIFIPPFHPGRYFKSSVLSTFAIDEFQLGQLGAVYGVLAMACYVVGGPLADRFSPRKLIAASLIATGLGGVYMSTIPSFGGLYVLFGFWGASTILAFWAPLIRATRDWGGEDGQGRAFGILDGGRGLAAALLATVAAYAFGALVDGDVPADPAREKAAVRVLLYAYAGCCFLASMCVWLFVPDPEPARSRAVQDLTSELVRLVQRFVAVVRSPAVWLQAVVIIAAYSTFKMFDNYGLYAEDAYGLAPTESAKVVAYLSFLRAVAALVAGWIADRILGVSPSVQACFGLLIVSYLTFILVAPGRDLIWLMVINMVVSCSAFFALRGIYFALLGESGIPSQLTGTAVGVICLVGFTPEIFMPPLTGWLIREARQAGDVLAGYNRVYGILIVLSVFGWLATAAVRRPRCRWRPQQQATVQ